MFFNTTNQQLLSMTRLGSANVHLWQPTCVLKAPLHSCHNIVGHAVVSQCLLSSHCWPYCNTSMAVLFNQVGLAQAMCAALMLLHACIRMTHGEAHVMHSRMQGDQSASLLQESKRQGQQHHQIVIVACCCQYWPGLYYCALCEPDCSSPTTSLAIDSQEVRQPAYTCTVMVAGGTFHHESFM